MSVTAEIEGVPSILVEGAALDLVDLVLSGTLPLAGFPTEGEMAWAPLPVALPIPAADAEAVVKAGQVVLEDAEGVQVALVKVSETWAAAAGDDGSLLAAGAITALKPLTHGIFRRLRLSPVQAQAALGAAPRRIVVTASPLTKDDTARVAARAQAESVLILALVGTGRRPYPSEAGLVKALLASRADLPAGSLVVPVPLPRVADQAKDELLASSLASAYGASEVEDASREPAALDLLLASGEAFAAPVLEVLRALRPPTDRRGLVLLFSGLSGSGKSTVAKGVEEALLESSGRTLTFLDGDVVRRNLSKGLGFSRADRDANVRRIGFVGAEVARHGGIAICAPIAPYASTRAAVRAMVEAAGGAFVLIHVATPLEVCEARDRKGLYALARAGKIPEFTGISDPYEVPEDADIRIDTSVQDVGSAVDVVLDELRTKGYVPTARREGS